MPRSIRHYFLELWKSSDMKRHLRKVWHGVIKGFKENNPLNAFFLAGIISSTIAWVVVSANNSIDEEIQKHLSHKNIHIQRTAVWAANFLVAFSTSIIIYLLMYAIFGYGEGMTTGDQWSVHHIKRILRKLNMSEEIAHCPLLPPLSYFPSWE